MLAAKNSVILKCSTFTVVLGHHLLNLDTAVYGTVLLATEISRTFELLDFDEYRRFVTSAFFGYIKRRYSSKANSSNVREEG